jgi:hypothetical protein
MPTLRSTSKVIPRLMAVRDKSSFPLWHCAIGTGAQDCPEIPSYVYISQPGFASIACLSIVHFIPVQLIVCYLYVSPVGGVCPANRFPAHGFLQKCLCPSESGDGMERSVRRWSVESSITMLYRFQVRVCRAWASCSFHPP